MAKKLLLSDTKLGWIRDTRGGADKLPEDKTIAKTAKPAVQAPVVKKGLLPDALIRATEAANKTETPRTAKSKAAARKSGNSKRPSAARAALAETSPINPIDKTTRKRQKIEPEPQIEKIELAPQPDIEHESKAKASLFHQTYEAALAPIVEKPAVPIADIPFTPKEPPSEHPMPSKLPYALSIAALISLALLMPERYRIFVFLGFIFVALLEVSYRVRKQHRLIKSISENRDS
jgi:hypothetical protein